MQENQGHSSENQGDINLIHLFNVLAKHKRMIVGITIGFALLIYVISLFIPSIYLAETKFFIPCSNTTNFSAQLINQMTPIATFMGGSNQVGMDTTKNNLYAEILKSRSLRDRIIDKFELMKVYNGMVREEVKDAILDRMRVKTDSQSGVIILGIEDTDPQRAADIANAFVEEFWKLDKEFALSEASQRRLRLEEQLDEAREELTKAENAMKGLLENREAVKHDILKEEMISAISQLRAQIAIREIQIKAMYSYSSIPQNPEIQRAEEEMEGLRDKLRALESKKREDRGTTHKRNIPSTTMEHARILGDLKYAETFYDLLQSQYQSARLDEGRNRIVLQVIEKAEPPVKAKKPRRFILVVLAVIAGFFISIITAFVKDFRGRVFMVSQNSEGINTLKKDN